VTELTESPETPPPIRLTPRMYLRRWLRRFLPPLDLEHRAEVQVLLRQASTPDFDYFALIGLSSVMATLGLLIDSVAVIIGAMVVAPLMSPILGVGLASVTGDHRLARDGLQAVLRGTALSVVVALLITLVVQLLPFNPVADPAALPGTLLALTHPSPFDLIIALTGGLAAAYALALPQLSAALPGVAIATALTPPLCTLGIGLALRDPEIAGGALLLYLTNLAAIGFAGILTFFGLGFHRQDAGLCPAQRPRSLGISAALVAVLLIPLVYSSARVLERGRESGVIRAEVRRVVQARGARLNSVQSDWDGEVLRLDVTLRSSRSLSAADAAELRDELAERLQAAEIEFESLGLSLSVVPFTVIEPEAPAAASPAGLP